MALTDFQRNVCRRLADHRKREGVSYIAGALALNLLLALRDWVDVINSHAKLQPLGYLMWAACGKDPGFSPGSLLAHARRTGRYSALELAQLQFEGDPSDAAALASDWHAMLTQAGEIIDTYPPSSLATASSMTAEISSRVIAPS